MELELSRERVVIKPNVTVGEKTANPDSGITVHPAFVHGIIEYANAHGAEARSIYILEDPRNNDDNQPRHWKRTGYLDIAASTGAKLQCALDFTCVRKPVSCPKIFPSLNVSRIAIDPNTVLINVPKFKTHNLAITTLCMKNLMGAVNVKDRHYCGQAWRDLPNEIREDRDWKVGGMPRGVHELWQTGLALRLIDTAQAITPHLNLVEGVVGRDGTGFNQGRNFALGIAVGGINMVAVDSVTSHLMGFDPEDIIYLKLAAEAGLGENRIDRLKIYTVDGESLRPCADMRKMRVDPPFELINSVTEDAKFMLKL